MELGCCSSSSLVSNWMESLAAIKGDLPGRREKIKLELFSSSNVKSRFESFFVRTVCGRGEINAFSDKFNRNRYAKRRFQRNAINRSNFLIFVIAFFAINFICLWLRHISFQHQKGNWSEKCKCERETLNFKVIHWVLKFKRNENRVQIYRSSFIIESIDFLLKNAVVPTNVRNSIREAENISNSTYANVVINSHACMLKE